MSMFKVFDTAASGMSAQTMRLNLVSSNMANVDSVSSSIGETYRARHAVFSAVMDQMSPNGAAVGVKMEEPPRSGDGRRPCKRDRLLGMACPSAGSQLD